MKKLFLPFLLFLFLWSCDDDDPLPPDTSPVPIQAGEGFFVLNEGGFNAGNASVDYYRISDNRLFSGLYEAQNDVPLGDVLQSMTVVNDRAFLVVNNSQKIVVVDPEDFVTETTIGPFTSPRYLLPVSSSKAYVSDLFSGFIYVLDLSNLQKVDSIAAGGWTEEMVLAGGEVFVSNRYSNNIYVVNPFNDQLVDTIAVGFDPASMAIDKNGKLWVICSGNAATSEPGGIWRIDPSTRTVEEQFEFADYAISTAPKLRFNSAGDTFYYLKEDIFKMSITGAALPPNPIVAALGRTLYALEVHPLTEDVFTSDAVDFTQRGTVYRYSPDGAEIHFFKAGVNPNGFLFY